MRRFASVFTRRDRDKDSQHKADPRRVNTNLAPLDTPLAVDSVPPTPVLSSGSEPASSSSSNGSASLSLQTPDDDHVTPTKTKSWTAWIGKRSGTIKRTPSAAVADQHWVQPIPSEWRPKQPAPLLPPPAGTKSNPPVLTVEIDSDEEDASSSGSDDDESVSLPHPAPALPPSITPTSVAQSRKNLEILIQNSLVPPLVPSPFAHLPGAPLYPRSSNPPRSLPVHPSMQAAMHKTLLLRRLQPPVVSTPVVQEELDRSILPFASRPPPTPVDPPSPLPWFNDTVPEAAMTISPSSPGLRRWMSRPCFEERIVVWVPVNGAVTSRPVTGSSFAVAELEYSAALDAMIGFGLPPVEEEQQRQPSPAPAAPAPTSQPLPAAAAASRNTPFMTVSSPLRNSALKSPVSTPPVSEAPSQSPEDPPPASSAPPTTSRVRFVEDDKEDVIPIGYALRLKKRREEKAKFLREEQERRAFELERAKQEEERLKRENERRQWEEEKRAWETEKRAMEEERKKRIYAEEVAAARIRREQQRTGAAGGGYAASNSGLLAASTSTASLRDQRNKDAGKYSRPLHDQQGPRRQASEPAVPQRSSTPSNSPHTSSPGSSRPPSVAGHQTGSHERNPSRPPSVHSTSEGVRTSTGKRSSMASLPGKNPSFDRTSTYSMWSASNPTLLMPPVPPVPMYTMDMPLLPPTPPFMLHQYPRPRSQSSSRGSASPSRQRHPSNGSSERVDVQHQQQSSGQSSSPRRGSSSPYRPDMSQTDQRRSSDDARRASLPAKVSSQHPPSSMRSQSSTSVARGRPPLPSTSQLHQPSPWTAPPLQTSYSQQQLSPAAIITGYTPRPPPQASRRQTTIS